MNYNLSLLKDVSRLLAATLTYIIAFATAFTVYRNEIPAPYCMMGIPVILLYCYLIQRYCYQMFFYVVLHAALLIPVMLVPFSHKEYRFLYLIMTGFEIIHAIWLRRQKEDKSHDGLPWYIPVLICVIYFIALSYQLTDFSQLVYYLGLGLIVLYFIRFFLSGMIKLLTNSAKTTSIPVKKILLNNTYLFLLFLFAFVILSIATQYSGLQEACMALGEMLAKILKLIIRFLFYIITVILAFFSKDRPLEEQEEAAENVEQALASVQEPTLLARILEGLVIIAGICLMAYFAFRVIRWFVRLFMKRYVQDSDIIVQLTQPKEEIQTPEDRNSIVERIKEFFKNDNASKIRRGYKLKIKSYQSLTLKEYDTPTDIAERIESTYQDDIEDLTEVYEKARYSNEEITFDDVKKGGLL